MYDLVKFYMIGKKRSSLLLVNKHTDRNTRYWGIYEPMDLGPKGPVDPEPRVKVESTSIVYFGTYSTNVSTIPQKQVMSNINSKFTSKGLQKTNILILTCMDHYQTVNKEHKIKHNGSRYK